MVAAAKLRRAQERAMAARPYAKMITSVLESLIRRIEIFDPETGNLRHPLFITRPEKRVLLVIVSGDKGFAGAFNANILKTAYQFIGGNTDKEIDVEAVGRKGRDQMRRRYPVRRLHRDAGRRRPRPQDPRAQGGHRSHRRSSRHAREARDRARLRAGPGHHRALRARRNRLRYIVYNEFKSVISQRLVVEQLLPLIKIGSPRIAGAVEPTLEERERAAEAARSAGIELEPADTHEAEEEAKKFGTADVDYIYEQPAEELFAGLIPQYVFAMLFHAMAESVAAEQAARMTAMDSATNNASDMIDALHAAHESRAPGGHHQGNH